MIRFSCRPLVVFLLLGILSTPGPLRAQAEQQPQDEEEAYGTKFFEQLRTIFGKFRDADLQRVFQSAEPIQCQELIVGKGEWRTVAFFNEDRSLGDWCRNSLEEVKSDLAVYIFKGSCRGGLQSVQVTTEFPVGASMEAYNEGRVRLDEVDVNVNDPVRVVFDSRTQAVVFDLPYLFLVSRRGSGNVYSLIAPRVGDAYATDVTSRSECKAVRSNDVTYRFLICRTSTVGRSRSSRDLELRPAFGATAYFILSDGVEAQSSVTLSFGTVNPTAETAPAAPPAPPPLAPPPAASVERPRLTVSWRPPANRSRLIDVGEHEFRIRFQAQSWTGRTAAPGILVEQKIQSPPPARLPEGTDYCAWRPGIASLGDRLLSEAPEAEVSYSLENLERNERSAPSVVFEMKSRAGARLGTLQCFFPRTDAVANVTIDRWTAVVGSHLALEIRR